MILIRKIDQNSTFDRYLLVQVHPHFEEETRIWPPSLRARLPLNAKKAMSAKKH